MARCPRLSAWQVASHAVTFYVIGCFAVVVQPVWSEPGTQLLVWLFWIDFAVTLGLYFFVCFADTRFREAGKGGVWDSSKFEPRRCDECGKLITRVRVKHCHTCAGCTEGFDHHCRYLNVCIGRRTYRAWATFVTGLALLMVLACAGALDALNSASRYSLKSSWPATFHCVLVAQFSLASVAALFLFCLLAQHAYFRCQGITTLEYIKDQSPGFPRLPPQGWRQPVLLGQCYVCLDLLSVIESSDPSEVWHCAICQADIGRAGVAFLNCGSCEGVNICPVCRGVAGISGSTVVTYRVSQLRRRALPQAGELLSNKSFRSASHSSVCSTGRDSRLPRRTLSAVVAAVEGHTGDLPASQCSGCWPSTGNAGGDAEGSDSESEETGSSEDGRGGL